MNPKEQYIQNLRDIMADMVHRVMTNPGSPWIQPSHTPLMDGFNRPFSGWDLLTVTDFRIKNAIGATFFCNTYQRKLFKRPVMTDEKGFLLLTKKGNGTNLYPCNINNRKLNEKRSLVERNRNELISKTMMRMHQLKFSPINKEGITMLLYKDITRGTPWMDAVGCFIAEMSSMMLSLELGLPKYIEPQNRKYLNDWLMIVGNRNINISQIMNTIENKVNEEKDKIKLTEINAKIFADNLSKSIDNLKVKNDIPRIKNMEEILTPRIKIK